MPQIWENRFLAAVGGVFVSAVIAYFIRRWERRQDRGSEDRRALTRELTAKIDQLAASVNEFRMRYTEQMTEVANAFRTSGAPSWAAIVEDHGRTVEELSRRIALARSWIMELQSLADGLYSGARELEDRPDELDKYLADAARLVRTTAERAASYNEAWGLRYKS